VQGKEGFFASRREKKEGDQPNFALEGQVFLLGREKGGPIPNPSGKSGRGTSVLL